MAKVRIRNHAEADWGPIIDTRLQLMLGSVLTHIYRIDVELERSTRQRDGQLTYACRLLMRERGGGRYLVQNQQPDAPLAIEGAIARARRTTVRRRRARAESRGIASA